MTTPFDGILNNIRRRGYHNHRRDEHSDLMTDQIILDLARRCSAFARDKERPGFRGWYNVKAADDRTTDYIFGPVGTGGSADLLGMPPGTEPDLANVRLLIEHKSIVTAHRNRNARFQDIEREMRATHHHNPKTIVVATVLVGTCQRFLNIPDCVKKIAKGMPGSFETTIAPRLSSGDQTLWEEFPGCISRNSRADAAATVTYFRNLPTRNFDDITPGRPAMDYLLLVPVAIDNVNPPTISTIAGIDAVAAYDEMIAHICRAYRARWQEG